MSATATRLTLAAGTQWANWLAELLRPACTRIEVAGSVRRQQSSIGDLDLVLIPNRDDTLLPDVPGESHLDRLLKRLTGPAAECDEHHGQCLSLTVNGPAEKKLSITHCAPRQDDGVVQKVEIAAGLYVVTPETWGVQLAIRTGPWAYSKALVTPEPFGGLLRWDCRIKDGRVWQAQDAAAQRSARVTVANGATIVGEWKPLETPEEAQLFNLLQGGWREPKARAWREN